MDLKRGIAVVFLFAFMVFSIGVVSAESCTVVQGISGGCPDGTSYTEFAGLSLSGSTNAHGSNSNSYDYLLCCDFSGSSRCSATGSNKILGLSGSTNAHAEIPNSLTPNYLNNDVCYGDLTCTSSNTIASCDELDSSTVDYFDLGISLSGDTNAHIGSFNSYDTKICCTTELAPPPETCTTDADCSYLNDCSGTQFVEGYCEKEYQPYYCATQNPVDCPSGQTCSGGACVPDTTGNCIINSLSWDRSSATAGDDVNIEVSGSNCVGSEAAIYIHEMGGNSYSLPNFNIEQNTFTKPWTAVQDEDGNSEYSIELYLVNTGASYLSSYLGSNPLLTVSPAQSACELTSVSWSTSGPVESGTNVQINVQGNNCDGETVSFDVSEHDAITDDAVTPDPAPGVFSGNSATGSWEALWGDYESGISEGLESEPPEFRVVATVASNGDSMESGDLTVNEPVVLPALTWEDENGNEITSPIDFVPGLTSVTLVVRNSGLNGGDSVSFTIREKDTINDDEIRNNYPGFVVNGIAGAFWTISDADLEKAPSDDGDSDYEFYFKFGAYESPILNVNVGSYCGDGNVDAGEECDDDNTVSGDGCSNICEDEESPEVVAHWELNGNEITSPVSAPIGTTFTMVVENLNYADGTMFPIDLRERDSANQDDSIRINYRTPVSQGTVRQDWTVTADNIYNSRDYTLGVPLESAPYEYYFHTMTLYESPELIFTPTEDLGYCGDGITQQPNNDGVNEECDDQNTFPSDGCTSSCTVENGWTCDTTQTPSVCEEGGFCGDGIIDDGEECDDGTGGYLGEPYGCTGCSIDDGWDCNPKTVGEGPSVCEEIGADCELTSASWSSLEVRESESAGFSIEGTNCDGISVSIDVYEKDGFLNGDDDVSDPSNIVFSGNSASGSWTSVWLDDSGSNGNGNPPEFEFTASVSGDSMNSDNQLLVRTCGDGICDAGDESYNNCPADCTDPLQCVGIDFCSDYDDPDECNADSCSVGSNDLIDIGVDCGQYTFNEETRCYEKNKCGCSWDEESDNCEPSFSPEVLCGKCGNGVQDPGEQCDDGNEVSGDGCSSSCELESVDPPCPEGTTLCNDGTCSLDCSVTDEGDDNTCNNDGVWQEGESCACEDADGEIDSCETRLVCSFDDAACCNSESDGICSPYCAYIDPDCGGDDAICGNGLRETGEQCDDGNTVENPADGCFANCTLQVIPEPPCPEGTTLCNDGTCSLDCSVTDEGDDNTCNNDGVWQEGESCACEDADGEIDSCETRLVCSFDDAACCNSESDGVCSPYCAYIDPDCESEDWPLDFPIGNCSYTEEGDDTCEDDGRLDRSLLKTWVWNTDENEFGSEVSSNINYVQDGAVWRYDPFVNTLKGLLRKSQTCEDIPQYSMNCPAQIKLPFFGWLQFVIAVLIVAAIYVVDSMRREKKR